MILTSDDTAINDHMLVPEVNAELCYGVTILCGRFSYLSYTRD